MQPNNTILSNNYPTKTQNNNIIHNNNPNNIINQPRTHNSNAQACAACKHQRRKCTPDCVLAPYFPHDRQRQFLNAHRLFGVSNIVKIVKNLQPPAKDHAMRTIIFQSDARAADPVGGCYRIIHELEQRISFANAELDMVLRHLAICRAAAHQTAAAERGTESSWNVLDSCNENENSKEWKWQFGVDDDMNSQGCMSNEMHRTESTSSTPLPNLVGKISLDDNGGINGNLDRLYSDNAKG